MANVFALTFTKDNDMETVTTVCKLCKKEILDKQEKVCVKPFVTETNDG
jgi:hydrogenase maturation factor HypF (carbamoyltransferase family)